VLVDGRNIYDPALIKSIGFEYRGFGRGYENGRAVYAPPAAAKAVKEG
jgi:hypothetical protein